MTALRLGADVRVGATVPPVSYGSHAQTTVSAKDTTQAAVSCGRQNALYQISDLHVSVAVVHALAADPGGAFSIIPSRGQAKNISNEN